MSSLLVFNRAYRLENGDTVSHFGIFDPISIEPLTFSLIHLPPPLPKVKVQWVAA